MKLTHAQKLLFVFVGGALVLLIAFVAYRAGHSRELLKDVADNISRDIETAWEERAKDTIGGGTPQETLNNFIAALEENNIDHAAEYFVLEKRAEKQKWLSEFSPEVRSALIAALRSAKEQDSNQEKNYSLDGNEYVIHLPLYIDFIRYPSGAWKIVEI
ncbi:MAG: hypothetical protein V1489_01965 [Candidatus Liptonbacteria bacterium]